MNDYHPILRRLRRHRRKIHRRRRLRNQTPCNFVSRKISYLPFRFSNRRSSPTIVGVAVESSFAIVSVALNLSRFPRNLTQCY